MMTLFIIISVLTCFTTCSNGDEQPVYKEVVDAANKFTLDLFQTVLSEKNNVVLSPLSVNILLGLVWTGAKDATAREIENAMNIRGDKQHVASGYRALMDTLLQDSKEVVLRIANKLFVRKNSGLKESFRNLTFQYFKADAEEVDLDPKNVSALAKVNKWVAEQTANKIKRLFPHYVLKNDAKAIFANVIYLKVLWASPFSPEYTTKEQFYCSQNKSLRVYMMHKNDGLFQHGVLPKLNSSVLVLPYLDSTAAMEMIIVLPNSRNGLHLAENGLKNVDLDNLHLERKFVNTSIPKFKIYNTYNVKDSLKKLGIRKMFTKKANLDGIANNTYISEAIQKTFIDVNEMGTEAAAATGFAASRRGPMPPDTSFIADHPFLFIIRRSNITLFIGRVSKPFIV